MLVYFSDVIVALSLWRNARTLTESNPHNARLLGHGFDSSDCSEMIDEGVIIFTLGHLTKHQKETDQWIEITDLSWSFSLPCRPMNSVRSPRKFSFKLMSSWSMAMQ
jgi:hypothetical protein